MKKINRKMKYFFVLAPVLLFALYMIPMTPASAAEEQFTITVEVTEGGTVSGDGSGVYNMGYEVHFSATPDSGYIFDCWYLDGVWLDDNPNISIEVWSDGSLEARFKHEQVTITVTSVAGGGVDGDGEYDMGETAHLYAYPEDGYIFSGWYENGERRSTAAEYSFTAESNRTLEARFVIKQFTINAIATSSQGGTVTGGGTYNYGERVQLYASPNSDYHFIGWFENGVFITHGPEYSFTAVSDRTIEAWFLYSWYYNNWFGYGYSYGYYDGYYGYYGYYDSPPPPPPPGTPSPPAVIVSPSSSSMPRDSKWQFSAETVGIPQGVTWTVTGGGAGTSISTSGILTVAAGETATTLTVWATSTTGLGLFGTATVTVASPITSLGAAVLSVPWQVLPDGRVGQIYSCAIQATGNTPMTWEIISGYLPPGLSLNTNTGAISGAPSTTGAFSFSVRVSNSEGSATGSLSIIVRDTATVTGVFITTVNLAVQRGTTYQFSASVSGSGNPVQTITWSVTGGSYGTSINSNGLLTVAANESATTLTIIATSTANAAVSGTSTVTLTGTAIPGSSAPQSPSQNVVRQTEPIADPPAYADHLRADPEPISQKAAETGVSEEIGDDDVPFGKAPQTGIPNIMGVSAVFCVSLTISAALWIYIILRKKVKRNNNGDE